MSGGFHSLRHIVYRYDYYKNLPSEKKVALFNSLPVLILREHKKRADDTEEEQDDAVENIMTEKILTRNWWESHDL